MKNIRKNGKKSSKIGKKHDFGSFWFILVRFWFTFGIFQKSALQVICKKNIPFFENGKALLYEFHFFKKTANFEGKPNVSMVLL